MFIRKVLFAKVCVEFRHQPLRGYMCWKLLTLVSDDARIARQSLGRVLLAIDGLEFASGEQSKYDTCAGLGHSST